jgi:hypothetical protein
MMRGGASHAMRAADHGHGRVPASPLPGHRDGTRVGAGPVRADPVGQQQGAVVQHFAEKALRGVEIALGGEQEVDRFAVLVDGPVQRRASLRCTSTPPFRGR